MKKLLVIIFAVVAAVALLLFVFRNGSKMTMKSDFVLLQAKPENIVIDVEEGKRAEAEFSLENKGGKKALVNIYKTGEGAKDAGVGDDMIEKLLAQKNLNESATVNDLKGAADFAGAPWLLFSPYYGVIDPGESMQIKLTIDAKDLSVGVHYVDLIALGIRKEDQKVIPVEVRVNQAAKLKVLKIEIDDGFSADTTGDQNHVADPGEKAALTAYLTNEGGMTASDITASLSFEDPLVRNLGDGTAEISSVASGQTEKARLIFEVGKDVSPEFPPGAILEMADRSGNEWSETFYLGEEGAFKYPTGLVGDEKNNPNILQENNNP